MIKFATSERSKFSQPMKLPEWGKRHGASQPAQQRAKRNEKNDSSQPQQSLGRNTFLTCSKYPPASLQKLQALIATSFTHLPVIPQHLNHYFFRCQICALAVCCVLKTLQQRVNKLLVHAQPPLNRDSSGTQHFTGAVSNEATSEMEYP